MRKLIIALFIILFAIPAIGAESDTTTWRQPETGAIMVGASVGYAGWAEEHFDDIYGSSPYFKLMGGFWLSSHITAELGVSWRKGDADVMEYGDLTGFDYGGKMNCQTYDIIGRYNFTSAKGVIFLGGGFRKVVFEEHLWISGYGESLDETIKVDSWGPVVSLGAGFWIGRKSSGISGIVYGEIIASQNKLEDYDDLDIGGTCFEVGIRMMLD